MLSRADVDFGSNKPLLGWQDNRRPPGLPGQGRARFAVADYIEVSGNPERLHSALAYRTPASGHVACRAACWEVPLSSADKGNEPIGDGLRVRLPPECHDPHMRVRARDLLVGSQGLVVIGAKADDRDTEIPTGLGLLQNLGELCRILGLPVGDDEGQQRRPVQRWRLSEFLQVRFLSKPPDRHDLRTAAPPDGIPLLPPVLRREVAELAGFAGEGEGEQATLILPGRLLLSGL